MAETDYQQNTLNNSSSFSTKNKIKWSVIFFCFLLLVGFSYYVLFLQQPRKTYSIPTDVGKLTLNWKTYKDNEYNFSFRYPPSWQVEKGETIIIKDPTINGNSIEIRKIANSSNMKPEEIIETIVYKDYQGTKIQEDKKLQYLSHLQIGRIIMGVKNPYQITNIVTDKGTLGPYVWIPSEELLIGAKFPFPEGNKTFETILQTFIFKKPAKPLIKSSH
jgi:hypothetical protein